MKKFLTLFLLLSIFTPLWAGLAPKPQMDFIVIYPGQEHPTLLADNSEQLQCQDNQCLQSAPLGRYGIQRLYCQEEKCFSVAYKYAPFQQLVLNFSDGVKRTSNIFSTPAKLHSSFYIVVQEQDLQVTPAPYWQPNNPLRRADAWLSLCMILLLELAAAWAYLSYTGKSYHVLSWVLLVNLITMPLSWQVLSHMVTESWPLWCFCFLAEALLLWATNRKRLRLRDAFNLSFAVNVTSYSVGTILAFLISPYLF